MNTSGHRKTRRWCRGLALIGAAWVLLSLPRNVGAWRSELDVGFIVSVEGGLVYVQGAKGSHVLEVLRECLWCSEGQEVAVTFSGYGRATLRPASRSHHGKPVRALLVRDGRMLQ
jgi:hypothetical protein